MIEPTCAKQLNKKLAKEMIILGTLNYDQWYLILKLSNPCFLCIPGAFVMPCGKMPVSEQSMFRWNCQGTGPVSCHGYKRTKTAIC